MSHSFFKLYYHFIWSTKYREPTITPSVEKILLGYLPKKIAENSGTCMALNMTEDHVHILVSILPKISVAEFVHTIKGSSSHFVNLSLGSKSFYWQSGYGVLSLSEKGILFVKSYIANQKQKHADSRVLDVLEYTPSDDTNDDEPSDSSLGNNVS